ncbi:hypothetical protein TP2_00260 [Thioclava pacifica DSM 10166]|uniref:Hydrogenase expression/formation protein HupK n=1 Tax=Thioclava pacifica DSM 10166 TaxID=1353537 RepID=A0A074JHL4_9RHOB|nr:hypothetical protein TP2_00260 [Thioclava pacifica DSM 10166]
MRVAIAPPVPSPVEAMMLGKSPQEVASLMPRLFNLCGVAQGLAARLALGLDAGGSDPRREILRDHLAKFCLRWPQLLGLSPQALPANWSQGGETLRLWLWGGEPPEDIWRWLASGEGVSGVLQVIADRFAPGEAVAELPPLTNPISLIAQENSPAGRVSNDPRMRMIEDRYGRGPLWRALGRAIDLDRLCQDAPISKLYSKGLAVVAAARGSYALQAQASDGRVTMLSRVTPTDHLLAAGGVLERSFATLPACKADLAPLLVDILDPCVPVLMKEAANA